MYTFFVSWFAPGPDDGQRFVENVKAYEHETLESAIANRRWCQGHLNEIVPFEAYRGNDPTLLPDVSEIKMPPITKRAPKETL